MIEKIKLALTSRTVYVLVAMFIINGIQAISSSLPPDAQTFANALLTVLAIFYKLNPSQKY